MAEKTEKPTPKRLKDSAKKGQVFRSKDLTISCLIIAGSACLVSQTSVMDFMDILRKVIAGNFDNDLHAYACSVLYQGLIIIMPVLLVCFFASALPALLQIGFILATEALKINLGALNPLKGLKKIFSLRTVKETVKVILYFCCFIAAFIIFWVSHRKDIFSLVYSEPRVLAGIWQDNLLSISLLCLGCILIVLIFDVIAEYFLFMKDMKMEKEEVKREMKEQDGNPEVKSQRRQLHFEILNEQLRSDIRNSRVLVVNPTHIAMGIYFRPEISPIPWISVRETNQKALCVKEYAISQGIPVVSDVKLARHLYATHKRYEKVRIKSLDDVLRLLVWLEQVENAACFEDAEEQNGDKPDMSEN